MNPRIKKQIKVALHKLGVSVRPARNTWPIDLTSEAGIGPVSAIYQSLGRPSLIKVPLNKCLHMNWLAFLGGNESQSPFVRTLIDYAEKGHETYEGSVLEYFYTNFQPKRAVDILGLTSTPTYAPLASLPAAGAPLLWRPRSPEYYAERRQTELALENREHGASLSGMDGDQFFGPVSPSKGAIEMQRLIAVFNSIRTHGFQINRYGIDNVRVACLLDDRTQNWKVMVVAGGQHRVAATSALGHEELIVELHPEGLGGVIRRSDYKHWPTVRSGYYSEDEALAIFDRIFEGRQPEFYQQNFNPNQ